MFNMPSPEIDKKDVWMERNVECNWLLVVQLQYLVYVCSSGVHISYVHSLGWLFQSTDAKESQVISIFIRRIAIADYIFIYFFPIWVSYSIRSAVMMRGLCRADSVIQGFT